MPILSSIYKVHTHFHRLLIILVVAKHWLVMQTFMIALVIFKKASHSQFHTLKPKRANNSTLFTRRIKMVHFSISKIQPTIEIDNENVFLIEVMSVKCGQQNALYSGIISIALSVEICGSRKAFTK